MTVEEELIDKELMEAFSRASTYEQYMFLNHILYLKNLEKNLTPLTEKDYDLVCGQDKINKFLARFYE